MKKIFVYLLTNKYRTVLYTGVTSNLQQRLLQHKAGVKGFTAQYKTHHLVYYEEYDSPMDAIRREKAIKSLTRRAKNALIEAVNHNWEFIEAP